MKRIITSFFITFLLVFSTASLCFADCNTEKEQILVKFKDSNNIEVVYVDKNQLDLVLAKYRGNKEVEYAEKNYIYKATAIPNDEHYDKQWYLKRIKAPQAWDIINSSPNITIAVIDSGVQVDHPDLVNNIWKNKKEIPDNKIDDDGNGFIDDYNGWDFINNSPDPSPKFDKDATEAGLIHGTVIAGIIAAQGNNQEGIAGLTWSAKILPLRVLDDKGQGRASDVIKAIDYAIKNEADIINLSFVGFDYSQAMFNAVKRAYNAGVLVVAAAGNELDRGYGYDLYHSPMYPVCFDGDNGENMVIGVAATDAVDQKATYSSYGFNCIDISAPGERFFTTSVYAPNEDINNVYFTKKYDGYWSGTSMAAPMVSATLALMKELDPNLTPARYKDILSLSADNISRLNPAYIGQLGSGRLNMYRSLKLIKDSLVSLDSNIIVAPQSASSSLVKTTNRDGVELKNFFAYDPNFKGGVNLTAGDLDGDGKDEIITGAGPGGGPHVRIFDANGNVLGQFFAYDKNFRGGVNISSGDLDGDGIDEIITGSGSGIGPHVRIFDIKGNIKLDFFAYDPNFKGGVNLTAGDLDGDGKDEIITGAGPGGGPHVRIFDANGNVLGQFFAYDKNFRGGVNVASGNVVKAGRARKDEIITGAGPGGGPHVRIFDGGGNVLGQFFAYDKKFRGGVNVALGDINQNGLDEIITGAGPGGGPHVRVFDFDGTLLESFYAYDKNFTGGVRIDNIREK